MKKKVIVTGGAGFIGSNTSARLIKDNYEVIILDNLSRKGSEDNLKWLESQGKFTFIKGDISDFKFLQEIFSHNKDVAGVFHLAGQVAVTTSVDDPRKDFNSNLLGTFNVLEAIRGQGIRPFLLYTSTNKVYGGMENVQVEELESRYAYKDFPLGIPESMQLDFHSPYGCSKGAGDQYVRDYARIYNLPTVVFRQSCIYGPRQFGVEDQGWIAWFIIAAVLGKLTSIYGTGKQVRDVLHVEDLIDAYILALNNPDEVAGKVFNVGGGPKNSISIWKEFSPLLEAKLGKKLKVSHKDTRPGDQPIYISDITHIKEVLGWEPKISPQEGIDKLFDWIVDNKAVISKALA